LPVHACRLLEPKRLDSIYLPDFVIQAGKIAASVGGNQVSATIDNFSPPEKFSPAGLYG